jgi:GcrA cell cycle regulator
MRLYSDDYSASLIADSLGNISRQAVTAKIHRLGLPRRGEGRHPTKELISSGQRTSMPRAFQRTAEQPPKAPPIASPALRCVEIVPRSLSLIDLEPGDCRYPYGDEAITFCGHPKQAGSQYCTPHHALCWVKPVVQRKAPAFRPYVLGAA